MKMPKSKMSFKKSGGGKWLTSWLLCAALGLVVTFLLTALVTILVNREVVALSKANLMSTIIRLAAAVLCAALAACRFENGRIVHGLIAGCCYFLMLAVVTTAAGATLKNLLKGGVTVLLGALLGGILASAKGRSSVVSKQFR